MKATTIYAARDVRLENQPDPTIQKPTDAIVKVVAACVYGSGLWYYRGDNPM
jgi:threonine dehydrogenase-like Zn-dependent dehydrogenase